ncbi:MULTISPECIES: NAD(P)H-binding protein [unclassified Amycolatopsis]|uniref:NAD(P)-dependent oxidoreductase n=1 Tax=unclassified Amycolatopsis TaxID=2618356 RepID=UPI0028771E9B|nr:MULTISPECIES: NAD(P)H-binding protein [unclassified Amycolatopsis]MDS0137630.1 NAD(P)H-binding protein [Amycolatopsis sp. 505]MDS0141825.1 NAD(P)H-binding protein [Amycolatopsis sp. CM201R]
MAKLVIFGATGYAGGRIGAEALRRGHEVAGVARHAGSVPEGVDEHQGSLHDEEFVASLAKDADVFVVATPARELDGKKLIEAVPALARIASENGVRLSFVGGAASLHVAEGGPRLFDTREFPAEYKDEAGNHAEVLGLLREQPEGVDWFYVSPAAEFGAWTPGERRGEYRIGGDVLVTDENGRSHIGGDDFAIAYVDEIERPKHRRARFTVAY